MLATDRWAAVAIFAGMLSYALAASQRDTTATDSLVAPLPYHGAPSALGTIEPYRSFTRASIAHVPYRTLEDVLQWRLPAYVLSTGSLGEWNPPLVLGERPRDGVAVTDGIVATSAAVGAFPPALAMPEFMERLDVLVGADAAVIAGANGGTAYWFQQPWYDVGTPYTRVWYCQSAYDFIATDGVLSQNVAPNVNATLGFRRLTGPGRYDNQWLDAWNTRALVRWNPSPRTNISLVHRFSNWGMGTGGGVNTALSDDPTNERTAIVEYERLDQRLFRHELQLLVTDRAGPQRVLTASVGFRNEEWNIYRPPQLAVGADSSAHVRWLMRMLAAHARWEERFDESIAMIAGIEATLDRGTQSDYTAQLDAWQVVPFGYLRWQSASALVVRGGVRAMLRDGTAYPIAGAGLDFTASSAAISLDVASSLRMPSQVEGNVGPERVQMAMVRVRSGDSLARIEATAYLRRRTDAIVAQPILRSDTIVGVTYRNRSDAAIESGATIGSSLVIAGFRIEPWVVLSFEGARSLPLLYATLSIGYQYRIGRNRLVGEMFVRTRTATRADRFVPQSWAFVPGDDVLPAAFDGATIALSAELGNAVVKLAMGNILSSYYATLSTFPQLDRHITLSVAWTFFD